MTTVLFELQTSRPAVRHATIVPFHRLSVTVTTTDQYKFDVCYILRLFLLLVSFHASHIYFSVLRDAVHF